MQVPNDVWCDLEGAKEHEEEAEEDVEAADDQTLTHDLLFSSLLCKSCNLIKFPVDENSVSKIYFFDGLLHFHTSTLL